MQTWNSEIIYILFYILILYCSKRNDFQHLIEHWLRNSHKLFDLKAEKNLLCLRFISFVLTLLVEGLGLGLGLAANTPGRRGERELGVGACIFTSETPNSVLRCVWEAGVRDAMLRGGGADVLIGSYSSSLDTALTIDVNMNFPRWCF